MAKVTPLLRKIRDRLRPYVDAHRTELCQLTTPDLVRAFELDPERTAGLELQILEGATPENAAVLERHLEGRELDELLRPLRLGHIVGLVTADGELAARMVCATTSYRDRHTGLAVRLAPGEAYTYAAKVFDPTRRSRGIGTFLSVQMQRLALDRADIVYGAANFEDRRSRRASEDLFGWEVIGQAAYVTLLNRIGVQIPFSARPSAGPVAPLGFLRRADRPNRPLGEKGPFPVVLPAYLRR